MTPRSRRTGAAVALTLALVACGGAEHETAEAPAEAPPPTTEDPAVPATIPPEVRATLAGVALSDAEIHFLDEALERSRTDYTERGLETFAEWELVAEVSHTDDGRWRLAIAGPRVDAEWELFVDRATGAVEEGVVATLAEPPPPEE